MKNYITFPKPTALIALTGFLLFLVFIIDLFAPLEIAVGKLYILCFFLICNQKRKTIISFTIAIFFLLPTKFILFYDPETSYLVYLSRILTMITILIIVMLSLKFRKLVESRNSDRLQYELQLEQMLFITSHKVRKPLANCFGLLNLFESEEAMTEDQQNYIINNLKKNAIELDTFTKELTIFMGDLKRKKVDMLS